MTWKEANYTPCRIKNDSNVAWETTRGIVPAPSAEESPDRGLIDREVNRNSLGPEGRAPNSFRNFTFGRKQRAR